MRRYTEEQRDVYLLWVEEQWNVPSRADWYAMQTACVVERKFAKNPEQIRTHQYKLLFEKRTATDAVDRAEAKRIHQQSVADLAKAQAIARVGGAVVKSTKRPDWAAKIPDEPKQEEFWPDFLPRQ